MTDQELVEILIKYYITVEGRKYYNRWDTWLLSNGYTMTYVQLAMLSDAKTTELRLEASNRADGILRSKLFRVLCE